MATKRKNPPKRDPEQTTLTISLPQTLKDEIEAAARNDQRSISNYLVSGISRMLHQEQQ